MHFVLGRLLRPAPAHPWTSDMETATKSTTLWWAHELHLDLRARPLQRSDLVSADKTLVELKHFISSQYEGGSNLSLPKSGVATGPMSWQQAHCWTTVGRVDK